MLACTQLHALFVYYLIFYNFNIFYDYLKPAQNACHYCMCMTFALLNKGVSIRMARDNIA